MLGGRLCGGLLGIGKGGIPCLCERGLDPNGASANRAQYGSDVSVCWQHDGNPRPIRKLGFGDVRNGPEKS